MRPIAGADSAQSLDLRVTIIEVTTLNSITDLDENVPDPLRLTRCPDCDHDLTRLPPEGECPNCGRPYDQATIFLHGRSRRGATPFQQHWQWAIVAIGLVLAQLYGGPMPLQIAWVFWAAIALWAFLARRSALAIEAEDCLRIDADGFAQYPRSDSGGFLSWISPAAQILLYAILLGYAGLFWGRHRYLSAVICAALVVLLAVVERFTDPRRRRLRQSQQERALAEQARHPSICWNRISSFSIDRIGETDRYRIRATNEHDPPELRRDYVDCEIQLNAEQAEALRKRVDMWRAQARR